MRGLGCRVYADRELINSLDCTGLDTGAHFCGRRTSKKLGALLNKEIRYYYLFGTCHMIPGRHCSSDEERHDNFISV